MRSLDLDENDTARLVVRCTHELTPDLTVRWFRDGAPVLSGPRTHIEVAGHAATLAIEKAAPAVTGVYRCSVSGPDGEASIAIPVAVRPRKPTRGVVKKPTVRPAPKLQCDVQEVDLIEGQTIHLSAHVTGEYDRKDVALFWEFRGQRLKADENEGVRIKAEEGSIHLFITECTLADAGVYKCHLQCGESREEIKIPVKVFLFK